MQITNQILKGVTDLGLRKRVGMKNRQAERKKVKEKSGFVLRLITDVRMCVI